MSSMLVGSQMKIQNGDVIFNISDMNNFLRKYLSDFEMRNFKIFLFCRIRGIREAKLNTQSMEDVLFLAGFINNRGLDGM